MSTNGDLRAQQQRQPLATTNSWNDWFTSGFANHLTAAMRRGGLLCEVMGAALSDIRHEYAPKIAALEKQLKELEGKLALDVRFAEMERALDARQAARDEAKRGPTGRQGERGARGERGERGAPGPAGHPGRAAAQITAWKVDRERYRAVPLYSDGKFGPAIELRDLFQQFLNETSESK